MSMRLFSRPSPRVKGLSTQQIQQGHLPMGPPEPGTPAAAYYAGLAQDQWREFSVSQRLRAWSAGKSLDLLSAEVKCGMLQYQVPAVHPVLLVHTPSLARSTNRAIGKVEKGAGSLVRALSRRSPATRKRASTADVMGQILNQDRAKPASSIKPSMSAHSMVPSIFHVTQARKSARHVHFNEALLPEPQSAPLARSATAPVVKAPPTVVSVRPSRTLPLPPKPEFGFILIALAPEISTPRPTVMQKAQVAPSRSQSIVPTSPAHVRPLDVRRAASALLPKEVAVEHKTTPRRILTRDLIAKEMMDRLCLSLALA